MFGQKVLTQDFWDSEKALKKMKTEIYCDSADLKVITKLNKNPIVDGFTTNPSLMRLSGARNYKNYSLKLLNICKTKPISLEVFAVLSSLLSPV